MTLDDGAGEDHAVDAGDASFSFAVSQPTVTHTSPPPTQDHFVNAGDASFEFAVSHPLGVLGNERVVELSPDDVSSNATRYRWQPNPRPQLDDEFAPGETRLIGRFQMQDISSRIRFQLRLANSQTQAITTAGEDLVEAWEDAEVALRVVQEDRVIEVAGPNHADNNLQDDTEFYFWELDTAGEAAARTFFEAIDTALPVSLLFRIPSTTPTTEDHAVDAGDASFSFVVSEPTVTHTPAPSGDSVTVDLGNATLLSGIIVWSSSVDLGTTFDADGVGQTLSQTLLYFGGTQAGTVTLSIIGDNNRFTADFEATGLITFESSDGETLEVMIADADTSEPYTWIPSNSQEVIDFATHVSQLNNRSGTLTLTGGSETGPTDHVVNAGDASFAFAVSEPTVTHTPAVPVTVDHAVNAGNAAFAFAVSQPTVTHVMAAAGVMNWKTGGATITAAKHDGTAITRGKYNGVEFFAN